MENNKNIPDDFLGIKNILNELEEKRKQFKKELENLPYTVQKFEREELKNIIEIKKRLNQFISEFEQEAKQFLKGSPEYIDLCDNYINKTIKYLGMLDIWSHKFSTQQGSGISEIPEVTPMIQFII